MLFYHDEKTGYILGYTAQVNDNSIAECDIPFAFSVMGADILYQEILEDMLHSMLDQVVIRRGNLEFKLKHKTLILPKRPSLGPREDEIKRLNLGPL